MHASSFWMLTCTSLVCIFSPLSERDTFVFIFCLLSSTIAFEIKCSLQKCNKTFDLQFIIRTKFQLEYYPSIIMFKKRLHYLQLLLSIVMRNHQNIKSAGHIFIILSEFLSFLTKKKLRQKMIELIFILDIQIYTFFFNPPIIEKG